MLKYLYAYEYISIWCTLVLLVIGSAVEIGHGQILLGLFGTLIFIYGIYLAGPKLLSLPNYVGQRLVGQRPTDAIGIGRLIMVPYVFFPTLVGVAMYEIVK